jgi:L-glutamine-phosphate cytidylyltransferase
METDRIKKAVLLAAGIGERLKPYTEATPKCLVEVHGNTLLGHLLDALEMYQFQQAVIVTGYKHEQIINYIKNYPTSIEVDFVHNKFYNTTNNIYSLWLARKKINEHFALLETDLIFEPGSLTKVISTNKIALDKYNSAFHTGTTAVVSDDGILEKLYTTTSPPAIANLYKTVNIYSFCISTWKKIEKEIGRQIVKGNSHVFYETAINKLVEKFQIKLEIADLSGMWWDEIDTPEDLERVKHKITETGSLKLLNRHQIPI